MLGWSALHYACLFRHRELVQYLLSLGLDPMATDKVRVKVSSWEYTWSSIPHGTVSIYDVIDTIHVCTSYLLPYVLQSGRTCLHVSICEGPLAIVNDLLVHNTCRITRMEVSISYVNTYICLSIAIMHVWHEVLYILYNMYLCVCALSHVLLVYCSFAVILCT